MFTVVVIIILVICIITKRSNFSVSFLYCDYTTIIACIYQFVKYTSKDCVEN